MKELTLDLNTDDWHTGEAIHLFTALAALLHDFGKASEAFQKRLKRVDNQGKIERNDYRHEWVSLRMFQAFVGQDTDTQWLARLAEPTAADDSRWAKNLVRDGLDGSVAPPFAASAATTQ